MPSKISNQSTIRLGIRELKDHKSATILAVATISLLIAFVTSSNFREHLKWTNASIQHTFANALFKSLIPSLVCPTLFGFTLLALHKLGQMTPESIGRRLREARRQLQSVEVAQQQCIFVRASQKLHRTSARLRKQIEELERNAKTRQAHAYRQEQAFSDQPSSEAGARADSKLDLPEKTIRKKQYEQFQKAEQAQKERDDAHYEYLEAMEAGLPKKELQALEESWKDAEKRAAAEEVNLALLENNDQEDEPIPLPAVKSILVFTTLTDAEMIALNKHRKEHYKAPLDERKMEISEKEEAVRVAWKAYYRAQIAKDDNVLSLKRAFDLAEIELEREELAQQN